MDNEEQGRMQLLEKLAAEKNGGNMWKVGESLGWDRRTTENMATDLMGRGLLAIANLSGGVRVTEEGMAHLTQCSGAALQSGASEGLAQWLAAVEALGALGASPADKADFAADLAAMKAQLQRSRPLPQVLPALLSAMQGALQKADHPQAAGLAERAQAISCTL